MANISEIDTLQVSDNLKTKFRDSVRAGNTIYTPTKQYTFQNWTGLVYITINPLTGFGSYIIGEGLNGGYTACAVPTIGMQAQQAGMCYWPLPRADWLRTGLYSKIEALIKFSKPIYTLGEKIYYYIRYLLYRPGDTQPSDTFDEQVELDSKNIGVGPIPVNNPNYEAAIKEKDEAEMNYGRRLGTQYTNKYDELIFKHAEQYDIPPALLKSLIYKESGSKFNPNSYRYEPCWDYNYFSGPAPSAGLNQHPYEHFRLAGYNVQGNPIIQGNQIAALSPEPLAMASSKTDYGLKIEDTDKNNTLTLEELWAQNDSVQHWSWFCTSVSNKNFTAQVLLAATYGLTQMGYPTAVDFGFDSKTEQGKPARDIYELFKEQASIEMGAKKLTNDGKNVPSINTCTSDESDDWWDNLKVYNGSSKYATEVCGYYNSGLFNEQE